MFYAAAPSGLDERPSAPTAPRRSRPSGRKNAHRGLAARRRPASGKSRPQVRAASGKNHYSSTTARRAHLLPQSNQGCQNNGLFARAGRDLISAGQWLSNIGNKTATAGADVAGVSAVASAVGIPAEPGIVLGAGVAGVGGGESLAGSAFQYAGGLMSQNSAAAGRGFIGMTLGWAEGVAFGPLAQFGLPGLPSGIPDPVDAASAAAASGSGGGSCP